MEKESWSILRMGQCLQDLPHPICDNAQCHLRMVVTGGHRRQIGSNLILMLHGHQTMLVLRVSFGIIWEKVQISFTTVLAHSPSPEHAEMIAINEGLHLVERFGYTNQTLESDCKVVINQLGHVHQQILSLVNMWFVVLSLIFCSPQCQHSNTFISCSCRFYLPSNVSMEVVLLFISTVVPANLI